MPEKIYESPERHRIHLLVAILVVIAFIGIVSYACFTSSPPPSSAEPLTIGMPPLEQSMLIYVAQDQGYFAQNGLNVTVLSRYPNGVVPVHDVLDGRIDCAVSAEYPVASAILAGGNLTILAALDRYQNEEIVARRDRGIAAIPDLRGKRIGYPQGTIGEFFLGRFLDLNRIGMRNVTLVPVSASSAADAIASGEIDALAYWKPITTDAAGRLGQNAGVWPLQSDQLLYGVVSARGDWAASHPAESRRLLAALAKAEDYSLSHPAETKSIVRRWMNGTDPYIGGVWPDHQFGLSLPEPLLTAMNDEARWMIANNLTQETTMPDYRLHIETAALAEVRPDAVNIR